MGVDISVFAKKAKIRLIADRAWVFSEWDSKDSLMYELGAKFRDSDVGLDKEWALYYLNECLNTNAVYEDREQNRKDYAKYWLDQAIDFVNKYPGDIFFIVTDHEDEYYDLCDEYHKFDPLEKS